MAFSISNNFITPQSLRINLNPVFNHYEIFTNTPNFPTVTMPESNKINDDIDDINNINNTVDKILNLNSEREDAIIKIGEYQKNYLKTNDPKWEKLMIQQEKRRDRIEIELNKVTKQYEELIKNRKTKLGINA